jgi:hypothetical protein
MSLLFNGMGFEPGNARLKVICIGSDQIHLRVAATFSITILGIATFSIEVPSATFSMKDLSATFSMKGLLETLIKNNTQHNTPY